MAKKYNILILLSFSLMSSFLSNFNVNAQDGTLDVSFNSVGKVTTAIGTGDDDGRSLAVQSDGKIVIAGFTFNGSNNDVAIVRYNSDGSLDNTFDSDGKVTTAVGTGNDEAYALTIQSDGKIIVVGQTHNGSNYDFLVIRYLSNGSLDNTFDSDGIVTTTIGISHERGNSVNIQSDGKIVVVGESFGSFLYDFAVVRYNSNGSLDASFDTDGKVITDFGNDSENARHSTIQPNGKILVTGTTYIGSSYDIGVVRYNSDGSLDNTFDGDGKVITDYTGNTDGGSSITVQPDGKIVVLGYSQDPSYIIGFALVRYNSDGSLDNTFDSDGKVRTYVGSGDDWGNSAIIQSDGKILTAGVSYTPTNPVFTMLRYNGDGSLDTDFDIDGIVTTAVGTTTDWAFSMAIQSDGKILLGGRSNNGTNWDFALLRYHCDCTPISSSNVSTNNYPFNMVTIYPNPAKGILNIELGQLANVDIRIMDIIGNVMHQVTELTANHYVLDIQYPKGMYVVELIHHNHLQHYKLLVE